MCSRPIHRHQKTSETMVVLRGRVVEEYYSSEGVVEASYELAAGGDARSESGMTDPVSGMTDPVSGMTDPVSGMTDPVSGMTDRVSGMTMGCALNIPAGQWHTLRALESGTVILEMKDGAYEPISPEVVMKR